MATTLHTYKHVPCTAFNRIFAVIYLCAILALLYHHLLTLLHHSTTFLSATITVSFLISDVLLGFMWTTTTSFRLRPIIRQVFPENIEKVLERKDFPAMDIFICTADPYKEPPINVVNTALSLMAYDYPPEKISVYVSDDGGSELTLFAFMEAAKFAKTWLPFCRDHNIMDRCPEVYFRSICERETDSETEKIKVMYESMKMKVVNVVERGKVDPLDITLESHRHALDKFQAPGFTNRHHPSIIEVLIESGKDKDKKGELMPNLVYVSRAKNNNKSPHHFKAGALNALLRVSAVMTNAPIVLTQDCDMYSNDPKTPHKALCYILDRSLGPKLGYIQFPQRYHGLNKHDTYGGEFMRLFVANPVGVDGLQGPCYFGTGCFFLRRVFFGGPTSFVQPEMEELNPNYVVDKPVTAQPVLDLAHHVIGCNYENKTSWGLKMGFRYGSLVEDYYTGYRLQCEGWKSIFCHPSRPAFLGDVPITLFDVVSQGKRWAIGLLEVAFSRYTPVGYGSWAMGPLMGLCFSHYAFWPIWSIPITVYSFLPQIALMNGLCIFPKVMDPWFLLYMFLFLGAYGQDCFDFIYYQGTFKRWWNDQRMWLIRGISPYLFGLIEFVITNLGMATQGFDITSKLLDDEQSKRYDQGLMEFGVNSPIFLPLTTAAIVNFFALIAGIVQVINGGDLQGLFVQMLIAGFGVLNSWPVYEAMFLRRDKGRMPTETTMSSVMLALVLCGGASVFLKN